MRGQLGQICRGLWRDARGAAMTEMAFVAPVLISLYLLAFILSDAVMCNRKVTVATRALTDVTSRMISAQTGDIQNVFSAIDEVLAPYPTSSGRAVVRISQVQVSSATQAQVIWTCTTAASNSIAAGSTITLPTGMATGNMLPSTSPVRAGAFLVMGEVTYSYTPAFTFGGRGAMTFADRIFLVPRAVNSIPLTGACPS